MTEHYFENSFIRLHYYRFGEGSHNMLCFHGYGMHGRQFKILEGTALASAYTFYGFDLFFHKETKLKDENLERVKAGISKQNFANLIADFCRSENIDRFSVMGYSMGTHYATVLAEELGDRIDRFVAASPSCLRPGSLVRFFSKSSIGNKMLEKLALSEKGLSNMLKLSHRLNLVDDVGYDILSREIATSELRFSFYACFTYLRFFGTDEQRLIASLNGNGIKSIFIFGKRDRMYPPGIGKKLIARLNDVKVIVLDETHEMINRDFVSALSAVLL